MDGVPAAAYTLLSTNLSLGLSLDHLRVSLGRALSGVVPSSRQLRRELERHPTDFRVLGLDGGPWRTLVDGPVAPASGRQDAVTQPPVVVPMPQSHADLGPTERIRRCVCWLGVRLDAESTQAVARWARLAASCAQTEARLHHSRSEAVPDAPVSPS